MKREPVCAPVARRATIRVHTPDPSLTVERLEDRITPVVGSFGTATAVTPGSGYDGVVFIQGTGGTTNTGALLSTGRHVLTAAHSVDVNGDHIADNTLRVRFDVPSGSVEMQIDPSAVRVSPDWVGLQSGKIPRSGGDWAVITLPETAPAGAERYELYRGSDEVGQPFVVIGYGSTGTGTDGNDPRTVGVKRLGTNRFESDALNLAGDRLPPGQGLIADFDSGSPLNDAFGTEFNRPDTGNGATESMIGPGDSGGPALIQIGSQRYIAGVASFALYGSRTDVDRVSKGLTPRTNNSFGEYFAYTRASAIASQIDSIIGSPGGSISVPPAPVSPPTVPSAGFANTTPIPPPATLAPLQAGPGSATASSPRSTVALGADLGAPPEVKLVTTTGQVIYHGFAYSNTFRGGVRVASGDVTGDGVADLMTAPGSGIAAEVKIFDGASGAQTRSFFAFEGQFQGGAYIAASDLNRDGYAELIVSPDHGGGPRVRVFDGRTGNVLADFLGIEDPHFRGGARIGMGDVNGDGIDDLLVGAGFGGGPRVAVFDGAALGAGLGRKLVGDFFVFEPSLRNGVNVDGGDFDRDGFSEIVVSGGPGGGPRVMVLSGAMLMHSRGQYQTPVANFFAGDPTFRGGVRVAVKDVNQDDQPDLVVTPGEGGGSSVRTYLGRDMLGNPSPAPTSVFDAFGSSSGVFVG